MSKDIIFNKKPTAKQLALKDWTPKRPDDEPVINMYTHARLLPNTKLESGDEFRFGGSWFRVSSAMFGSRAGSVFHYRRSLKYSSP